MSATTRLAKGIFVLTGAMFTARSRTDPLTRTPVADASVHKARVIDIGGTSIFRKLPIGESGEAPGDMFVLDQPRSISTAPTSA